MPVEVAVAFLLKRGSETDAVAAAEVAEILRTLARERGRVPAEVTVN